MLNPLKIISASQTREADLFTINNEPISSIDLMERASKAFVNELCKHIDIKQKIAIVCGIGNNGGDGLAVARLLSLKGYQVTPYLIQFNSPLSTDCRINLDRLEKVITINSENEIPNFEDYNILIDALLGTGLKRPVKGFLEKVIFNMNHSRSLIFSIDIASGVFCDDFYPNVVAVKSDLVISFQRPKLAFFMPEYGEFIKQWTVVDIGLNESFVQSQESTFFVLDNSIKKVLKRRKRFSHKGTYGHSLIIAGSYGKMGAAVLASKACLKSGSGLLTVHSPKSGYEILQSSIPEAMFSADSDKKTWSFTPDISVFKAIGVGPGIGKHPTSMQALKELLNTVNIPIVIDADGLNLLSQRKELISIIPKNSILTPHVKEFDRLVGESTNSNERWNKQINFSVKNQLVVVLKDAHSTISDTRGKLYFNTSGNPGMATAGSGDVLTGIITGLLAQDHSPLHAALIGVYFHGKAGDDASLALGEMGLIASDIIDYLTFKHT